MLRDIKALEPDADARSLNDLIVKATTLVLRANPRRLAFDSAGSTTEERG